MKATRFVDGVYTSSLYSDIPIVHSNIYSFIFSPPPIPVSEGQSIVHNVETGQSYTKSQVKERTDAFARYFSVDCGVGDGDVVFVCTENGLDYGPIVWGAHRLNAIISPVNPANTPPELQGLLQLVVPQYNIKCVVASPTSLQSLTSALSLCQLNDTKIILLGSPELESKLAQYQTDYQNIPLPDIPVPPEGWTKKIAFLAFSSGTTGLPKGVIVPHTAVIANVLQARETTKKYDPAKHSLLVVLPFFHAYANALILHHMTWICMPMMILPKFSLEGMLKAITRYKTTHAYLVPPQLTLLAKHPLAVSDAYDLSSLELIYCGAAPVSGPIAQMFRSRFPKAEIHIGLGTTETYCYVAGGDLTSENPEPSNYNSVGKMMPSMKIKIVDPESEALMPPGKKGEVWICSPSNALGYLGDEEASKQTFDEEGYFRSGDEGFIGEDDGELYLTDRLKELIKCKGFQVAPAELEGHLLMHEAVTDVCVIGVPDEYAGELPRAYVVLKPDLQKEAAISSEKVEELKKDIQNHVQDHFTAYKWLKGGVEFVESVPKTPSGKILRKIVRGWAKTSS